MSQPANHKRPSLGEWIAHIPMQLVKSSMPLGWNDVVVHYMQLNPNLDYYPSPISENNFLVLVLDGSTQMQGRFPGKEYFDETITLGSLITFPRQIETEARWDAPAKSLFLEMPTSLTADLAASAIRGDPERIELVPSFNFTDPFLHQLGMALYNELENDSLLGELYSESIAHTVALHLLRHYSNAAFIAQPQLGKLTALQVRILNEYIQTHLHQKISLADLATCIHMSVSHFERLFRATLHRAPYRYVLECRIDKAKLLLRDQKRSAGDVGRECGFRNHSHFTKHFTRLVGVSPARYQKIMDI